MTKPQNPLLTPTMIVTRRPRLERGLKILLFLAAMGWIMNVSGLVYISYRLFGAGFVCHPEGVEDADRASFVHRGIDG
jgi:hypothetical protein